MGRRLFVGNVPFAIDENDLRDFVNAAGHAPVRVSVPVDRETRKPRGFAFLEFESSEDADKARGDLHGMPLLGRTLKVDVAKERER